MTRIIVYAQYSSIGEMTTFKPVHGGFIRQCIEYIDPAWGFAIGMNFWFAVGGAQQKSTICSSHTDIVAVGHDYPGRNHSGRISSQILA